MKIRLIPKVRFINFRSKFPNMSHDCFSKWFAVSRCWNGRIVTVHVKALAMQLDFRRNWVADMIGQ